MSGASHLVLIPSYNTGRSLERTVGRALCRWPNVWVVVDGSTDGSDKPLRALQQGAPGLRVMTRERNGGKGAAVLDGAREALREGFTHALVLDADGQHPEESIPEFMEASAKQPAALVLGDPVFGPEAPLVRLKGRLLSVWLVRAELLGPGVNDPLFGFRVYPLRDLVTVMESTRFARRYDFDPEVAVRLVWAGTRPVNLKARCRYLTTGPGDATQFKYFRDNAYMVWLHTRLLLEMVLWRWTARARFGNRP